MSSEIAVYSNNALTTHNKSMGLAYFLWLGCFVGFSGLHRIYMGRWVTGIIWMATLGLLGFGNVIDLVLMPRMVDDVNRGARVW